MLNYKKQEAEVWMLRYRINALHTDTPPMQHSSRYDKPGNAGSLAAALIGYAQSN